MLTVAVFEKCILAWVLQFRLAAERGKSSSIYSRFYTIKAVREELLSFIIQGNLGLPHCIAHLSPSVGVLRKHKEGSGDDHLLFQIKVGKFSVGKPFVQGITSYPTGLKLTAQKHLSDQSEFIFCVNNML